MVYNAARIKDAGGNYLREAAMAKLFASRVAESVARYSGEAVVAAATTLESVPR